MCNERHAMDAGLQQRRAKRDVRGRRAHASRTLTCEPGCGRQEVQRGHARQICGTTTQGKGDVEDRAANAGRPLRERRVVKPCPACKADIADFLAHAQVNRCGA